MGVLDGIQSGFDAIGVHVAQYFADVLLVAMQAFAAPEFDIVHVNDAWCNLCGFPPAAASFSSISLIIFWKPSSSSFVRATHDVWSDGAPFTSEDIRFWYEDIALNQELQPAGLPAFMLAGGKPPVFEVIDETTVRFAWDAPNPLFAPELAKSRPPFIYRPAHYLKQFHAKYGDMDEIAELAAARKLRNLVLAQAETFASPGAFSDGDARFVNPEKPTTEKENAAPPPAPSDAPSRLDALSRPKRVHDKPPPSEDATPWKATSITSPIPPLPPSPRTPGGTRRRQPALHLPERPLKARNRRAGRAALQGGRI